MFALCHYNPRQHMIIHPQLETSLRSRLPAEDKDNLFVYFHRETKNYVVAWWAKKGERFVDSHNVGKSLRNFTKEDFHSLIRALRNVDGKSRMIERMKRQRSEKLSRQQDEADAKTDRMNHAKSTALKVGV